VSRRRFRRDTKRLKKCQSPGEIKRGCPRGFSLFEYCFAIKIYRERKCGEVVHRPPRAHEPAEFERALIRERQREGIAIAKKKGLMKGRQNSLNPEQVKELQRKVANGIPKAKVAREFKITRQTLYKYLKGESL